jgi:hypothetical protein
LLLELEKFLVREHNKFLLSRLFEGEVSSINILSMFNTIPDDSVIFDPDSSDNPYRQRSKASGYETAG